MNFTWSTHTHLKRSCVNADDILLTASSVVELGSSFLYTEVD